MNRYIWNRCFFSPDDGGGIGGGGVGEAMIATEGQGQAGDGQGEQKTFTQAELDKILSKRLGEERLIYEKKTAEAVKNAQTEAQKLATLTAEERAKVEAENALKAHQDKIADVERREREIAAREMKSQALEALSAKGLPGYLLPCANMSDAESCNASIEALEKYIRDAIKQGVEDHVKKHGYTPPTGSTNSKAALEAAFGL